MEDINPTTFQRQVLAYRRTHNILNAGGRGSGKSFCLQLDVLDHCIDFGRDANALVVRESYIAMTQLMNELFQLCMLAFPHQRPERNKAEQVIHLPNGASIWFTQIADEEAYMKNQGRTYTLIACDEVGVYPPQAFKFMHRLRSNLRVPKGRMGRMIMTANPGGKSHSLLMRDYITKAPPWKTFLDEQGMPWVWTTSNYRDNPHIDQTAYQANLLASVGQDKALADAWLNGNWTAISSSMFKFDPARHIINYVPATKHFKHRVLVGCDWGSAAPAVGLLAIQLLEPISFRPDPQLADISHLPNGTVIVLDETDTAPDPMNLSVGNGASASAFGEQVLKMVTENNFSRKRTTVIVDDARGLHGDTVSGEFRGVGLLSARKPYSKSRTKNWVKLNQLLHNSASGDGPGILFHPRCRNLLQTLPEAPRGTLNAEDLDPRWQEDHWCDALGLILRAMEEGFSKTGRTIGDY